MVQRGRPLHVSIVATSEAQLTPLCGLFGVLNSFQLLASLEPDLPTKPFEVEIVGPRDAPMRGASGLPIVVDRSVSEVDRTDIAIVPLMMFAGADWKTGRYPDIVDCLHPGADIATADRRFGFVSRCSGFLYSAFAETLRAFRRIDFKTRLRCLFDFLNPRAIAAGANNLSQNFKRSFHRDQSLKQIKS
jgi:hypothetical protein